ncbi:MAG: CBS domain-containing protein [Betaproteobacteria bacterium]|nr:CBS domain-containing protein [Betaproteobacteria bacterium]
MPIGEFCNREVVIAARDSSVLEAARLMRQYHVGDLVIVDALDGPRRPVGIVTDRDVVVEVVVNELDPAAVRVDEIMGQALTTVRLTDGVFDTIALMRRKGIRRVPVVNELGELAGIVTVDDVIGLLAEEMNEVVKLVAREQAREGEARP